MVNTPDRTIREFQEVAAMKTREERIEALRKVHFPLFGTKQSLVTFVAVMLSIVQLITPFVLVQLSAKWQLL